MRRRHALVTITAGLGAMAGCSTRGNDSSSTPTQTRRETSRPVKTTEENTNDPGSTTTEPQDKRESETEQNGFPSREEFYSKPDDDHIGFPLVSVPELLQFRLDGDYFQQHWNGNGLEFRDTSIKYSDYVKNTKYLTYGFEMNNLASSKTASSWFVSRTILENFLPLNYSDRYVVRNINGRKWGIIEFEVSGYKNIRALTTIKDFYIELNLSVNPYSDPKEAIIDQIRSEGGQAEYGERGLDPRIFKFVNEIENLDYNRGFAMPQSSKYSRLSQKSVEKRDFTELVFGRVPEIQEGEFVIQNPSSLSGLSGGIVTGYPDPPIDIHNAYIIRAKSKNEYSVPDYVKRYQTFPGYDHPKTAYNGLLVVYENASQNQEYFLKAIPARSETWMRDKYQEETIFRFLNNDGFQAIEFAGYNRRNQDFAGRAIISGNITLIEQFSDKLEYRGSPITPTG